MKLEQCELSIQSSGRGTQDITAEIKAAVSGSNIQTGLCHIFLKHTSASIILCENYDEQVRLDLERFLSRLVPDGDPLFQHVLEGKDDMPAHIRTVLTKTDMMVPIADGALALGTWQGIFLYEHRYVAQKRQVIISAMGS